MIERAKGCGNKAGLLNGRGMLSESCKSLDGHPLAHHATNMLIEVIEDEVTVLSKEIGMYRDRTGSTVYRDALRKTSNGWRIATKRRYETVPEPS